MRLTAVRSCLAVLVLGTLVAGCTAHAAPNPPRIVSLTARQEVVGPLDSCLIECVAEDDDGDELTYTWTADSGTINGYAGTVAWTAPEIEGLFKISVEVSDGSELPPVSATLTVRVKENHFPVIDGFGVDKDWVKPGESCVVTCTASDIDEDVLEYRWVADCGSIEPHGATAIWTAPDFEGTCSVTVYVSDTFGGERDASTEILVAAMEPLVVTDMTVTAAGDPRYLRDYDQRFKILKEESCYIRCTVNDPERVVTYEWTDGNAVTVFPVDSDRFVFGDRPDEILWTAPKLRDDYVIVVTAWDSDGHYAQKNIVMRVETCTCAFPAPEEDDESEETEESEDADQ
jgi:hypothetical protein